MKLYEIALPDPRTILGPDYIDRILQRGMWVHHGSHISCYIDDKRYEPGFPEHLSDEDESVIINHPDFKEYFSSYIDRRMNRVYSELVSEIRDGVTISRVIAVKEDWVKNLTIEKGRISTGVYWSVGRADGHQAKKDCPIFITFHAPLDKVDIDWRATIESRMDYMYGDEEAEIQIVKGSTVMVSGIDVDDDPLPEDIVSRWIYYA